MKKSPSISTNEGPPNQRVTIEATVVPRPDSTYPVVIEPYKLDLSQFTSKVVDHKSFEIHNVSDQSLDVTLVAGPMDLMDIKLPQSIPPGGVGEGEILLTEEAVETSFAKSFTFELNDENKTRFTVPVKRDIRQPTTGITSVKESKKDSH